MFHDSYNRFYFGLRRPAFETRTLSRTRENQGCTVMILFFTVFLDVFNKGFNGNPLLFCEVKLFNIVFKLILFLGYRDHKILGLYVIISIVKKKIQQTNL